MSSHYLYLILTYTLGVMGIYTLSRAVYRFIRYSEIPLVDLLYYPSTEELSEMGFKQFADFILRRLAKSIFFIIVIPMTAIASHCVILVSMLWLNRELGLELSFLADWYGPNMEIIR